MFACAVDWPGWCRIGKDEATALELLAQTAPRFAAVAAVAGLEFPSRELQFNVVDRVEGSVATDFGAPSAITAADTRPFDADDAARSVALLRASWKLLDSVAASAPSELRKGPRGGGRDTTPIVEHVQSSECAYGRRIGIRDKPADLRPLFLERLATDFDVPAKGWPGRYAARRIIWHVVDHIWEIQDKSS